VRAQNEVKDNDEERENQEREHHEETSDSRRSVVDCLPFQAVAISLGPFKEKSTRDPRDMSG